MRIILSIFSIMIIHNSLFAQMTHTGNRIKISFMKQNYFSDEAIEMSFSIMNINNSEQTFILSDVFNQSINFKLYTAKNELMTMYPEVEARMNTTFANPALYRKITLVKGESYSRIFNLRDFYAINKQGTFYIKVIFYPNPDNKAEFYESEMISFSHTPSPIIKQKIDKDSLLRKQELQKIMKLLPNEVIASLFESQLLKDWNKFLLHIDFERLINSFNNYAQQYKRAENGIFRLDIIEQFKRFLTSHWDIPLISYKIQETIIQDDIAYVTVNAVESIGFTTRKLRYNFTLYKTGNNTWLIEDYTVLSLN